MPTDTPPTWRWTRKTFAAFMFGVCVSASSLAIGYFMWRETSDPLVAFAAPVLVDGFIIFGMLEAISGHNRWSRGLGWTVAIVFVALSLGANWIHHEAQGAHWFAKVLGSMFPLGFLLIKAFWRLDNDPDVARKEKARVQEERRAQREADRQRMLELNRDAGSPPVKPAERQRVRPELSVAGVSSNGHHKPDGGTGVPSTPPGDGGDLVGRVRVQLGGPVADAVAEWEAQGRTVDDDGFRGFLVPRLVEAQSISERTADRRLSKVRELAAR
jgi:hypothetical protein